MSNNNYNKQPLDLTDSNVEKSDDEAIGFLLNCVERGEYRRKQRPPSICKVSRILRDLSKSSYKPQLVSIGPIHREDKKLQKYEWVKECYLNDLLSHCEEDSTPKEILEACLLKVNTLIDQIRESYAGVKKKYSDVDFAKMMVMDGFFILEFCFKHKNEDSELPNKMQNLRIAMDLILLENQVPFFVLKALFDCLPDILKKNGPFTDLSQVLDNYLAHYIDMNLFGSLTSEKIPTHDHVLGYMHKRYEPHVPPEPLKDTASHSIEELDRSGVNFKPHQQDEWSMTIKFQSFSFACLPWLRKPTLQMPALFIEDFTELIFRNFIAYEQSFPQDRNYFTSYACAMDMLIETQKDIAKLVESKVLVNDLGSNQEAADMINRICKNVFVKDFYYTQVFIDMDTYYNRCLPKNIAMLKRVYFSNPWSAIALFAAIIVFSLSVFQTVYSVMGT